MITANESLGNSIITLTQVQ